MGRRALRKIDPHLDLSRHFYALEELELPLRLSDLFSRPAPLEVEIGSGKGLFMARAAAALPDHNFLGIEISRKYARYSAARLAKRGLENAVMLHGDGLRLMREGLTDASLAAVHVYFPDPWWKARHRKRRVMKPALLHDIERTLAAGGALHFWTDVKEYNLDYRTHFERRMRLHGEPVYRSEFRRADR